MLLSQLQKNSYANILAINADKALKNRLNSFGVNKGAKIKIEELTLTKSTIEISINRTRLALRLSEAKCIEVEKC